MDLEKILPSSGPPIEEVSKYIEKYKNDLIVIKYGGNVFIDRNIFNNFIADISLLNKLGLSIVVIHGGGPRIKKELERNNMLLETFILNFNENSSINSNMNSNIKLNNYSYEKNDEELNIQSLYIS